MATVRGCCASTRNWLNALPRTPAPEAGARNPLVDLARVLSVLVVVGFHSVLFYVWWDDGVLQYGILAIGEVGWVLSWFLQVMPLFFLAGGFAHTRVVDRMLSERQSYGYYLASRGRRLLGPLGLFVGVIAALSSLISWAGWFDTGVKVGLLLSRVLWFMAVYIAIVLLAPWLVRLQDRLGVLVPIWLTAIAILIDIAAAGSGELEARGLNLVFVWFACHQLGVGFGRGWLRRGSRWFPALIALASVATIGLMVSTEIYPPTAVGLGDHSASNLVLPTAAMIMLCLAQMCLLAILDRRDWAVLANQRVTGTLSTINSLLVTTYLWHVPIIGLAMFTMLLPTMQWPTLGPYLLNTRSFVLVAIPLLVLLIPRLARLELRLIPELGPRQSASLAVCAFGFLMFGTYQIWCYGTVVHPAALGSTWGVLMVLAGSWLLSLAGNRPERLAGAQRPAPLAR